MQGIELICNVLAIGVLIALCLTLLSLTGGLREKKDAEKRHTCYKDAAIWFVIYLALNLLRFALKSTL